MTRDESQYASGRSHSRSLRGPWTRLVKILAIVLGVVLAVQLACAVRNHLWTVALRNVCAANLAGVGKAMRQYAGANMGSWPIAPHAPATQPGVGRVTYAPGMIGKKREGVLPGVAPFDLTTTELSTTASLWMLVRTGNPTNTSFVCPTSTDYYGSYDNVEQLWDFESHAYTSYGYQVPYGQAGWPREPGEPRMVLMADKGPYGAALEAGMPHPGAPTALVSSWARSWRPWNTVNHERMGQNVLRADGSTAWSATPLAGVGQDNIYTRWSDPTGGSDADPTPRIHGTPPTGIEMPFADTDSLIYP